MKKIYLVFIATLIILGVVSYNFFAEEKYSGKEITVYKSESCGCCVNYIPYLENEGFKVNVKIMDNMDEIKKKYNIPKNMESCHTAIIGNYFVEGHVPMKAVNNLLDEKPDINGIALPDMPSGSPGMPGTKAGSWIIYSIKNNEISEFMRI